jgi:hypothetical protein
VIHRDGGGIKGPADQPAEPVAVLTTSRIGNDADADRRAATWAMAGDILPGGAAVPRHGLATVVSCDSICGKEDVILSRTTLGRLSRKSGAELKPAQASG